MTAPADILIVDDDAAIRQLLAAVLDDEGFSVREARDGHEALAQCNEQRPDLMLLDLSMPGLDGLGVLTRLERDGGSLPFPIVVISGNWNVEPRLQDRVSAVIIKPFDLEDVVRCTRGLVCERDDPALRPRLDVIIEEE